MKRPQGLLGGPLALSLFGMAFCLWSAFGNDINFCVSAGCSLYQDFNVGGVSLWWFGSAAFAGLALLALVGAPSWGVLFAGIALCCDILLLLLMIFTAPCISCLTVAVVFAITYILFRHAEASEQRDTMPRRSVLLYIWLLLFVVNVGFVIRSQSDVWAINDIPQESAPNVRMFFSPSCAACRQGVEALSGSVDTGFYPITENVGDLAVLLHMQRFLREGQSMAEALKNARAASPDEVQRWTFDALLLRLRLLRNKAHIFLAGARAVPFIEYHGLPRMLLKKQEASAPAASSSSSPSAAAESSPSQTMPLPDFLQFGSIAGQCSGGQPCDDPWMTPRQPR